MAALAAGGASGVRVHFLHPYLIYGLRAVADAVLVGERSGILWAACSVGLVLLLTLAVGVLLKRLLGQRSSYFIGA